MERKKLAKPFAVPETIDQLIDNLQQESVESRSERIAQEVVRGIETETDKHHLVALTDIEPFVHVLRKDPDRAIGMIFEKYHDSLEKAYGKNEWITAIAGGPYEAIPIELWNAVGSVYPLLNRNQKNHALRQVLGVLDKENYFCSQGQVEGIREPQLVSDICVTRRLYWPGLSEGKSLIEKYNTFSSLKKAVIDESGMFDRDAVSSDFLVAVALLHPEICDFGEDYVLVANPIFLNRTLGAITAKFFAGVTDPQKIEKSYANVKKWTPKSVHDRINAFVERRDWANPKDF